MQLPLIARRGPAKPYGSIPRIDWSHPLAAKLAVYVYDIGGVYVDLVNTVSGTVVSASATFPSVVTNKYGSGFKFAGTVGSSGFVSFANASGHPTYTNFGGTLPWSFVAGTIYTSANSFTSLGAIATTCSTDNAEDTGPALYTLGSSTVLTVGFNNGATNVSYNGSIAADYQTWGCVSETSTTADLYRNGVLDKNATSISSTTHSVATAGKTGCFSVNAFTATNWGDTGGLAQNNPGFLPFYAGWLKALTPTEFKQIHDDPYCFLIYPEDEIFASIVGTSGVVDILQAQIWM